VSGRIVGGDGLIRGRLVLEKARLADARVTALANPGVTGEERAHRAAADERGEFRLPVPPGEYYLFGSKDPDLFAVFGGNPVTVREGMTSQVVLRAFPWRAGSLERGTGATGVEGRALFGGEPLAGATVQVFLDAGTGFRGPGYALARTDPEGRFSIPLTRGRYYLVARRRMGTDRVGPLKPGDRHAWYPGNPFFLDEGETLVLDLPFLEVEKDPAAVLAEASGGTTVAGRIVGADGKPIPGRYACLYGTPEPLGMPLHVSGPSSADGSFSLRVSRPGVYHLVVRGSIGEPLRPGEYLAFWKGPQGSRLTLTEGGHVEGLEVRWEAP
jgi:hypothetical protein